MIYIIVFRGGAKPPDVPHSQYVILTVLMAFEVVGNNACRQVVSGSAHS